MHNYDIKFPPFNHKAHCKCRLICRSSKKWSRLDINFVMKIPLAGRRSRAWKQLHTNLPTMIQQNFFLLLFWRHISKPNRDISSMVRPDDANLPSIMVTYVRHLSNIESGGSTKRSYFWSKLEKIEFQLNRSPTFLFAKWFSNGSHSNI